LSALFSRLARRLTAARHTSSHAQQATFTEIFRGNGWQDAESVSGPGSTRARGAEFRTALIALIDDYGIRSIVDAPCGDFNWMQDVLAGRHLPYTGVDIVEPLIAENVRRYATPERRFLCLDMTRADLPTADLILCRDGLVHLSFADARAAIRNFRRSGSRYLLATTFVNHPRNEDAPTGGWRVLNMQAAPFAFPPPLALVDERCTRGDGGYRDKRLGLWPLAATNHRTAVDLSSRTVEDAR
jgi:Methyltransferase domain